MNALIPIFGLVAAMVGSNMSVDVVGAVNKPLKLELSQPTNLRTIVKQTGGLSLDADQRAIVICASDGTKRTVDLTRFDQDLTIRPGDQIKVPRANPATHVFLSGGLQTPGAMPLQQGDDLRTIVTRAGVPNPASLSQIQVIRDVNGQTRTLDVDLTTTFASVAVLPGDKVVVPHARRMTSDRELLTIVVIGLLILVLVSR